MMEAVAPLNNEPTPKAEPTTSIQYSAFGYVLGHLELDPESPKMGKLLLTDGTILPVYLFHQSKLDQISLDQLYAWRIYFRTDRQQNLNGLKLVEAIKVEDETKLDKLLPSFAALDHFRIRGLIHNIWKGQISLRLERNNIPPGKEDLPQWKPFYITVLGKLEPRVNKGDAIEIVARRFGMQLHLVEANPIDETALKSPTAPKSQKTASNRETSPKVESNRQITSKDEFITDKTQETETNLTTATDSAATLPSDTSTAVTITDTTSTTEDATTSKTGVIMINGKTPEITIKFSDRPSVPEKRQGKKSPLRLQETME